jgi:hypothetical protein
MSPNGNTNMRKAIGRVVNRPTITGGKRYDKIFVYIPSQVANDTAFPFETGTKVEVEIKGKTLSIKKTEDAESSS